MAGGIGTRLWPLSRQSTPKQFQKLIGDQSLIQQTFTRINRVIPAEQIWIMTGEQYVEKVLEQLPQLARVQIITEPVGRNTAPATLLALLTVLKTDPEAVLFGLLPADHYVGKEKVFAHATESAFKFIESNPEYVVTLGIHPTDANTGLGYIEMGDSLAKIGNSQIFKVHSFYEKPDLETAQMFFESGRYLWNGGYYLFNGSQMLKYYEEFLPKTTAEIKKFTHTKDDRAYKKIKAEPIDKAISEKLSKLAVIPTQMKWSDIGNWATLHEILSERGKNSQVAIGNHIGQNSENSLIMGGNKLIVTIGVKDIVVIDTEDAILVCDKGSVHDVKKIVEQLQQENRLQLL